MKHAALILVFTVLVTLFYNYVGHLVPQNEVYPPKAVEVGENLTTAEMVEIGGKIVNDKQKCMSCHSIHPRYPDLDGIGARAKTRREGYSDVDYLAEALYEPDAFIVPSFDKGMTPANKPPLLLNDREILAVIASLQSLGGTPSVTMQTKLKYQGEIPSASAAAATPPATSTGAAELTGEQLAQNYGCIGCHSFTKSDRMVGPSLFDIGKRLTAQQIYEALIDPDATIADGNPPYPGGLMSATLNGTGFYDKVTTKQLKTLVEYLKSRQGVE